MPDANVCGVSLLAVLTGKRTAIRRERIGIGAWMPLQATLFSLAQDVATAFHNEGFSADCWPEFRADLAVFTAVKRLGTLARHRAPTDGEREHAVFVAEENRFAWTLDPSRPAERVIEETARRILPKSPEKTEVFLLEAQATKTPLAGTMIPEEAARGIGGGVMPVRRPE